MYKQNAKLQDIGIERSILSSIITYGSDIFCEVEQIISQNDFYHKTNSKLFYILQYMINTLNIEKFDTPSILTCSHSLSCENFTETNKDEEYIEALFVGAPTYKNTLILCTNLYKLSIARQAYICLHNTCKDLLTITGNEDIDNILKMIEQPSLSFIDKIECKDQKIIKLTNNFEDKVNALFKNESGIGLSSGFPIFDSSIGGGLRSGCVYVLGARSKIGKSYFCLNLANNISKDNIPVLYLDTELNETLQFNRLLSLNSGVELNRIEQGHFKSNKYELDAIKSCKDVMKSIKIDHYSVAGQDIETTLSIVRRWVKTTVGLTDNGKAKPCLIIYDYLKLMTDNSLKRNIQEYQVLGFIMTKLHNFALKWHLPIFTTVQLNRDGIEKERSDAISGSDRILWLCSAFAILKDKTSKELKDDPKKNGNKKIIVLDTRNGPGMDEGEYINIKADLSISKMTEGIMSSECITEDCLLNEKII